MKIIGGLMAIACLFTAVGFVLITPDPNKKYTEFYMLGADGLAENYPTQAAPGELLQIPVGITNHEGTQARYRVEVHSGGQTLTQTGPFTVEASVTWENLIEFRLPASEDNQPVEILLFGDDDITPYRSLRLWVDVR
jgi:uncharacterized membrane protein